MDYFSLRVTLTHASSGQDRHHHSRWLQKGHRSSCCLVTKSCPTLCSTPHELQHARSPCPSPTPEVYPNSCPLSQWCHPTIPFAVIPFSSCPQSFLVSGSFQMSQLCASGGQSTGVSALASVFPVNIQDQSPLGWTSWISLIFCKLTLGGVLSLKTMIYLKHLHNHGTTLKLNFTDLWLTNRSHRKS